MEFRFGSDVVDPDAEHLGQLARIVYDPETTQIVALVVQHGLFDERNVLVPIGSVRGADENAVQLELSPEQFDRQEDFADDRNLAPPPDVTNIDEDQVTDPVDIPDVPPLGAATGVESIGFTPIVEETTNVPAIDQIIDDHTQVWATDGQVGHVHCVEMSDQTERITAIVVKRGILFAHEVTVPAERIARIQTGRIILNVDKAHFKAG